MYKKKSDGLLKHIDFILFDLLCIQIAFFFSYVLRHDSWNPYVIPLYRNMAIFVELADIIIIILFDSYKNVLKRGYYLEFISVVKQAVALILAASLYLVSIQGVNTFRKSSVL